MTTITLVIAISLIALPILPLCELLGNLALKRGATKPPFKTLDHGYSADGQQTQPDLPRGDQRSRPAAENDLGTLAAAGWQGRACFGYGGAAGLPVRSGA